jgi:putative membrane protein
MSGMNVVSQVFALIAAVVHLFVWPLESFLYGRHAWVREFLTGSTSDAPEVRLWRFNVGFYNLFLALGMIAGFVAVHLGHETAGRTLVLYLAAFMVAGGITLFVSAPKLWRGALGQAVPGAVVLVTEILNG